MKIQKSFFEKPFFQPFQLLRLYFGIEKSINSCLWRNSVLYLLCNASTCFFTKLIVFCTFYCEYFTAIQIHCSIACKSLREARKLSSVLQIFLTQHWCAPTRRTDVFRGLAWWFRFNATFGLSLVRLSDFIGTPGLWVLACGECAGFIVAMFLLTKR